MLDFHLFRSAFAYGNIANLTSAIARGGLQIYADHLAAGDLAAIAWILLRGDLWSAIFMLPLTASFLLGGPIAGYFSDRIGGLPFAIGGMLLGAAASSR